MSSCHIWSTDSDHVQVSTANVFYTYTRGAARHGNITSMVRNLDDFMRAVRKPVGYVLQLAATAAPPSSEDGALVTGMFNRHAAQLVGVALVIDASGFKGAVLRSATTMVFVMKRQGFKTQAFPTLAGAADWLGGLLQVAPVEIIALAQSAHAELAHFCSIAHSTTSAASSSTVTPSWPRK